jgi:hypothetical protein
MGLAAGSPAPGDVGEGRLEGRCSMIVAVVDFLAPVLVFVGIILLGRSVFAWLEAVADLRAYWRWERIRREHSARYRSRRCIEDGRPVSREAEDAEFEDVR